MSDPYGPPYDPNRGYGQSGYPGQGGQGGYGQSGYPGQGGGYSDPGYNAPQSGGPSYGDPNYGDPGYGQPSYPQSPAGWGTPQSDPGYPGYQQQPPPQYPGYSDQYSAPPPKKSKAPLIIGIVVVVLLVLCGGGIGLVLLANKSTSNSAGSGSTSTPTSNPTGGTATTNAPPPTTKISFNAPDRIGVLRKSSDQSRASGLKDSMSTAGLENPFAVMYEESTNKGHLAVVWGGTGSAIGGSNANSQLDAFFGSAGTSVSGGTVGAKQDVDPGAVGGAARCAPVSGTGVVMNLCAWATDNAVLGFIISGVSPDKAADRMRQMLQAIVVKG